MLRAARTYVLPCCWLLLAAAPACDRRVTASPSAGADPLPSWVDGRAKKAVLAFVSGATTAGGPGFIPPPARVAAFDNDGTLWPEKPVIQGIFILERLKRMAIRDPGLATRQPFQAALAGDIAYLKETGEPALMTLVAATSGNLTEEEFDGAARAFFQTGRHPTLEKPFTSLGYQPMLELLQYLRANGFATYLCSGGDIDFMRAISQEMYGIPPENVIGSSVQKQLVEREGKVVLWRRPALEMINDKEGKPPGIDLHVGRRPVLAAGNVRSGGDIAMLRYSQEDPRRSLQLVIDHDDEVREFAYEEPDGATLAAARRYGWTVVSMKRDWRVIFWEGR